MMASLAKHNEQLHVKRKKARAKIIQTWVCSGQPPVFVLVAAIIAGKSFPLHRDLAQAKRL